MRGRLTIPRRFRTEKTLLIIAKPPNFDIEVEFFFWRFVLALLGNAPFAAPHATPFALFPPVRGRRLIMAPPTADGEFFWIYQDASVAFIKSCCICFKKWIALLHKFGDTAEAPGEIPPHRTLRSLFPGNPFILQSERVMRQISNGQFKPNRDLVDPQRELFSFCHRLCRRDELHTDPDELHTERKDWEREEENRRRNEERSWGKERTRRGGMITFGQNTGTSLLSPALSPARTYNRVLLREAK
jgi:hypothetical protein